MKKVFLSIFLLYGLFQHLIAAGPITHGYLTERFFSYFSDHYSPEAKKAFMLGTLFPDIRYIADIPREKTHFHRTSLAETLEEPSPFIAGMKFHSYVDWVREEFVLESKIYEELGQGHPPPLLYLKLKMLEDDCVYPMHEWSEWRMALREIHPEELEWGLDSATVRMWHNLLDVCFSNPPRSILFLLSMTHPNCLSLTEQGSNDIQNLLNSSSEKKRIKDFVFNLLQHFESKFLDQVKQMEEINFLRFYHKKTACEVFP